MVTIRDEASRVLLEARRTELKDELMGTMAQQAQLAQQQTQLSHHIKHLEGCLLMLNELLQATPEPDPPPAPAEPVPEPASPEPPK